MEALLQKAHDLGNLAIAIEEEGELITQKFWDEDIPRDVYSVSKSLTSIAVGFAIEEGHLSLEDKLEDFFKTDLQGIRLKHLLTMTIGSTDARMMVEQRKTWSEDFDWLEAALSYPQGFKPGTHFCYSNDAPYLAGLMVQERTQEDLVEYLTPRLWKPLDIEPPEWLRDDKGRVFGSSGLQLRLGDMLKIGHTLLKDGDGIIPKKWVQEATKQHVITDDGRGYGYLFWRGAHDSFRADGKLGQFIIQYPHKQAVVVTQSNAEDADQLLKHIEGPIYDAI